MKTKFRIFKIPKKFPDYIEYGKHDQVNVKFKMIDSVEFEFEIYDQEIEQKAESFLFKHISEKEYYQEGDYFLLISERGGHFLF